jgi:hypothetical protein
MRTMPAPGTTTCQRIDSAMVFVSGIAVPAVRLGSFLEQLRSSHEHLADPLAWPAALLEAAFRRTFGVPVAVTRYAFGSAVAFHVRLAGQGLERQPVA